METKMIFSGMSYKIAKRGKVEPLAPGRRSELSRLKADLFKMKPGQKIIVPANPDDQKIVGRRMRVNIQHWKTRDGLKHVSVHLTTDGNVQLTLDSKRKGGRVVYGGGLENR